MEYRDQGVDATLRAAAAGGCQTEGGQSEESAPRFRHHYISKILKETLFEGGEFSDPRAKWSSGIHCFLIGSNVEIVIKVRT